MIILRTADPTGCSHYQHWSNDDRPNLKYSIPLPNGGEIWPKKQWQWAKERALRALEDGELVFKTVKGVTSVSYKQYLRDSQGEERKTKPQTIIDGFYTQRGTAESVALFGELNKFSFPKPEGLISQFVEISSKEGDLVLDSFLGSGTTAAVAHKMGRRYIGIEMGDHAVTHCAPRLRKVIEGEQGGISKSVGWQGGGGFRFYRLGSTVFDEAGNLREGIRFEHLAAHIWFSETRTPRGKHRRTPLLGVHEGTAYYLLYNGILGDQRPGGGNVLTRAVLAGLPVHDGPKVIYGESSRLGAAALEALNIVFKQTPYDVRAR